MKEKILEVSINKEINCSANVAWWNYWDMEHIDIVHSGYKKAEMLYESKNFAFSVTEMKIPFIPFLTRENTPIFVVKHDDKTQYTFAIQFGVLSKTTITINPIERSKCKIKMNV